MIRSDNEFDEPSMPVGTINYSSPAQGLQEIARQIVLATLEGDRRVPELDTSPSPGRTWP